MPRGLFTRELTKQLEAFAVVFLLPMFFCFSGLNTRLDMVNSVQMLLIALVILISAILGKGGACWAAARFHGEDNATALAVGALMNARGLMDLIILNIGLQKGLIEPAQKAPDLGAQQIGEPAERGCRIEEIGALRRSPVQAQDFVDSCTLWSWPQSFP